MDIFQERGHHADVKSKLSVAELHGIVGNYDGMVIRSATKVRGRSDPALSLLPLSRRLGVHRGTPDERYDTIYCKVIFACGARLRQSGKLQTLPACPRALKRRDWLLLNDYSSIPLFLYSSIPLFLYSPFALLPIHPYIHTLEKNIAVCRQLRSSCRRRRT